MHGRSDDHQGPDDADDTMADASVCCCVYFTHPLRKSCTTISVISISTAMKLFQGRSMMFIGLA